MMRYFQSRLFSFTGTGDLYPAGNCPRCRHSQRIYYAQNQMESCIHRASGSQTSLWSGWEKRPERTSISGRTSGSIKNSYGAERGSQKNGFPFRKNHWETWIIHQWKRDFQRISGCTKRKSSKSLLYLRSFLRRMQIPLEKALTHYLYAQTSAIVTNCVKTIPLSQTSGQQLLSGCYGEFDEILKDVMTRSEEDMCLSAPGFDIRGIQHEKLYSRLYMS